ncbi:MAG TPA: hypothetical protein VD763_13240 [Candidatus Saccharimonadales bacterium]|nr:hypothetical protein [Candidatus Saccharimonadales bacterium]
MTPDRTWDPIRFQRGTRAFAALVTFINGAIVLGVGLVVAPAADLPHPLAAWVIGVAIAVGIGHLVAVVALVQARPWAAQLVAYLAAVGIGAAVFAFLLVTRAGIDVLGAGGATTAAFLVFMTGWWLVGTRFALKAFAPARREPLDATPVAATTNPAPAVPSIDGTRGTYVIRPIQNVTFA